MNDSSYKARKLGVTPLCIFASPAYVQARDPVTLIDDLSDWDRVKFVDVPWAQLVRTADGRAPTTEPKAKAVCNSVMMAKNFVDDGQGFIVELFPVITADVWSGKLVQVLPEIALSMLELYAVYPANASKDGLTRLYVDFLAKNFPRAISGWQ